MSLSRAALALQDDRASQVAISFFGSYSLFRQLSIKEGTAIVQRDAEDATKLAEGIMHSVKKGLLLPDPKPSPAICIDVLGLSADAVASRILQQIPIEEGKIIVLQGLSGTGKGTTVRKLQQALPRCVTWSNGNIFRSLTYLVSRLLDEMGRQFAADTLTDDVINAAMNRLHFARRDDVYEVLVDETPVSAIENTELKQAAVGARVPTVASLTQGEVIRFASKAVQTLRDARYTVILEGRSQTLDYIPTPYRFELVMNDSAPLGERRAAQRIVAEALKSLDENSNEEDVRHSLLEALQTICNAE